MYTGGKITALGCGQNLSIEKPGEYMILQAGMMYNVGEITSGSLFLIETKMYIESGAAEPLPPNIKSAPSMVFNSFFTNRSSKVISAKCRSTLNTAIDAELRNYPAGVLICLTSLYPITHSPDPDNNHIIYTDSDALQGKDAVFYRMLSEDYAVSIVTVYLCRNNSINPNDANNTTSTTTSVAVATVSTPDNESTSCTDSTLVGCIVDNALPEIEEGAMYKIVPVVYGYGETFRVGDNKLGTLLTGLLVTKKEVK